MDMRLYFSLCAWAMVLSAPVIHTSTTNDIILTPGNSQVTFSFNSSEPFCCDPLGNCRYTCEFYVSSPPGTILKATFLSLQIPSNDQITFMNRNTSEDLLSLSGISSLIDPIYSDSSHMKISFDRCDGTTPYSYLEAEFSFLDRFQDSSVRSSGGAFELSDAYPNITIQSVNLSSLTDLEGQLHWFITASTYTWIKIDILVMEPGQGMVCIFDTFATFGEWVCMTDSVPSTTWYSYDEEMRMTFYINPNSQPGVGLTVKLSIVDHSTWTGQSLILPACNPTVILEDTQTIQFVTPYFNQSLQNVRYQCRMHFTSRDAPASVEFMHFDLPGKVSIYSLESGNRADLADATGTQVDISADSPVVSISPTHEIILDLLKNGYTGNGNGLMMQAYTIDPGPEPIASFGIAIELNDTSSSRAFTTLGYPILPGGDINIRWLIDRVISNTAIKVEFIDFDIGTATLFVHEMDDPPIFQLNGSSLPDDVYSDTQMLTLLLRSDQSCCTRAGFYFNVTLIKVVDECTNAPCENGGTCIEEWESFSCSCPVGFAGGLCQNLITTVGLTSGLSTTQGNTAYTTSTTAITTSSTSTSHITEASTRVKSPHQTSPSHTSSHIETTITTLRPQPVSNEPHPTDTNVLIIALSISLTIAFVLIAFLVCVVVYRSKQARTAAPTNPEFCSQGDLIQGNSPTSRYHVHPISNINHDYMQPSAMGASGFTHPPPEYETIKPLPVGGAQGGAYVDLDLSAVRPDGDYEKLRGNVTTPSERGIHQNPPNYTLMRPISPSHTPVTLSTPVTPSTPVTSVTPDYMRVIPASPAGNRDSECSYVEPNSIDIIRMNGVSPPPLYNSNIEQTTTFHK